MATEVEQVLRTIARLAEEQGDALDRAFRVFGDGALLGDGATRLHAGMVERHQAVQRAFMRAYELVERLAGADGKVSAVPVPPLRPPPAALRAPPGGYVGGDPDLMLALNAELGRAGTDWQAAGQALAAALLRSGLGGGPGQEVAEAGTWLLGERADLRRRRTELLKTPATTPPAPQPGTLTDGSPTAQPGTPTDGSPAAQPGTPPAPQPPETSVFGKIAAAAGEAVASVGAAWADQVGAGAEALGLQGVAKAAHEYADHVAVPLTRGIVEGAAELAEFGWNSSLGGLLSDPGAYVDRLKGAFDAGTMAARDPVGFGKQAADWDTLVTDPVRWFGRLVPDVLLGATTAGAGTGGKVAERLGRAADDASLGSRAARHTPSPGFEIPPPRTAADGPPLDTIPMREQHLGEENRGIRYLSPAALERRRLVVQDGKLYDIHGKPFDTSGGTSVWAPGKDRAIFVMDRYGNLYAAKEHQVGKFHHSSFLSGGPVAGAGDMEVENGVLKLISRHSGHYFPSQEDLERVLAALKRAGLDTDRVEKEGFTDG